MPTVILYVTILSVVLLNVVAPKRDEKKTKMQIGLPAAVEELIVHSAFYQGGTRGRTIKIKTFSIMTLSVT
jgi:hypothetical protein